MTEEKYNTEDKRNIHKIVSQVNKLHSDLLRDFITYWSIKKSPSKVTNDLKEVQKNTSEWLLLIKSNHEFRKIYGDDVAKELITIIEASGPEKLLSNKSCY